MDEWMDGRLHVKMRNEEADDEREAKTDETYDKTDSWAARYNTWFLI